MTGSHKILTVSYGTFSCTLEGFEDAFGTMKAIAEYFRDLAADDRYFGAEPPTPDAHTLQRIAERELSRRVDARREAGGIVLRAAAEAEAAPEPVGPPEPAGGPEPAPEPSHAPSAVVPVAAAVGGAVVGAAVMAVAGAVARAAAPGATPPEADEAPVAAMPPARLPPVGAADVGTSYIGEADGAARFAGSDASGVAGKLDRIRAVVGRARDAALAGAAGAPVPVAPAAVAPAAEVPEVLAPDALAPDALTMPDDAGPDSVATPDPTPADPAPAGVGLDAAPAPGMVGPDMPARDAVAPARPRVVRMRRAEFEAAVAAGAIEDARPAGPAAPRALSADEEADLLAELAAVEAERVAGGAEPAAVKDGRPAGPGEDLGTEVEGADARTEGAEAVPEAGTAAEPETEPEEEAASADAEAERAVGGLLASLGLAAAPARPAELVVEPVAEPVPMDPVAEAGNGSPADDEQVLSLLRAVRDAEGHRAAAPDPDPDLAGEPSGFVAVEAFEAEASAPARAAEVVAEEPAAATALEGLPDAEAPGEPEAAPAPPEAAPDAPGDHAAARGLLAASPDGDEAALARILSRTDAQLADPEAARRREAIAQLKAAVAATEAARRMGEPLPSEAERADGRADAFRDDLDRVVRPRRPVGAVSGARPERPRPAPLKLVASQRVDLPDAEASARPAGAQPVRPRRVLLDGAREAAHRDAGGDAGRDGKGARGAAFAAFAAEMRADSLTDLLEAAAAFLAHVEGLDDFSRPQVIDKVRQVAADRFSREDGLRSFGTLLRQGVIRRADAAGRFRLAAGSRFDPARRAG